MITRSYRAPNDIFNDVYDQDYHLLRTSIISGMSVITGQTYTASSTANITGSSAIIFGPEELLNFNTKCFTVKNSGSNTISHISLQCSPNNADWEDLEVDFFKDLTPDEIRSFQLSLDSRKYWRLSSHSVSGNSIATVWLTANTLMSGAAGAMGSGGAPVTGTISLEVNKLLSGLINNTNKNFTSTYNYQSESTFVYKNGVRQIKDTDYAESLPKTIIFSDAPLIGDVLRIDYIRA